MHYFKPVTIFLVLVTNLSIASDQSQNKIDFNMPDKFTDFSTDANRSAKGRDKLMKQLTELMNESISEYSKYNFEIVIHDIDMPGRFTFTNTEFIRIIEDSDRTRFEFSYNMLDSEGKSVKKGDINLTDRTPNNFKRQFNKYKNTYFSNEMRLFNDWLKEIK